MNDTVRKVAIIGGSRIPFCRSNTIYGEKTNMDMLSAALQGTVDRFDLHGKQLDEVVAGAVTTHSKDWNLAREALLSTSLSPLTPGITLQQACGTSLQAALGIAAKIACGQIECGIAAGTDTTSDPPIVFGKKLSNRLVKLGRAKSPADKLKVFKGFSPAELTPVPPANAEPRTLMSMGEHCERMAREWNIRREDQDQLAMESHLKAAAAYDEGFFDPLVTPWSGAARDNNVRGDSSLEKLAGLRTVFSKRDDATLTAGNSTPLTDGAASVLLASEAWAKANKLPIQGYLVGGRSAAVDFVHDEGLLMAPTVAVAELLTRHGLALQDFDFYELHEAFAAQVLCTLKAWESEDYCKERLGLDEPLGSIDRDRMNVKGSSLAVGHPFAATGARILGTLSQLIEEKGAGRGLISVCTAGGMGVAAIVER
ncbi:MAG: acetyl-CoA C-acetyltransferase [Xanthomonadales bacterium]|jgi:acetyl-CoA C-acetyltransferase|nr:acetyl-CoA C-acetyltransferase [Xanthomonadales bacterium]